MNGQIGVIEFKYEVTGDHLQVVKGSHHLLFEFWDLFYVSGTVGAINFKFRMRIDARCTCTNEGNAKLDKRQGVTEILLKFWDPFHISGTIGAINFEFGMQIDRQGH